MKKTFYHLEKGAARRILASALAVCMVFTMSPPITAAQASVSDSGEPVVISEFAELPDSVWQLSVPLGTSLDELNLPGGLKATAYSDGEDASLRPPMESALPGEIVPPTEEITPPAEEITPPEETTPPAETITPPEESIPPTEGTTTPPEETATPPEETIPPAKETTTPPEETATSPESSIEAKEPPAIDAPTNDEQEKSAPAEKKPEEKPESESKVEVITETMTPLAAGPLSSGDMPVIKTLSLSKAAKEHILLSAASPSDADAPSEGNVISDDADAGESSNTELDEDAPKAKTVTIRGITWESNPIYDGDTAGAYIFTAVLPSGYTVEDGASLPIITVTVGQAEQSAVDKVKAMIDALPTMDEWTAMDETAARAVMDKILAAKKAYDALTAEEKAQIDETRTAKLMELAALAEQMMLIMPMAAHSHDMSVDCGGSGVSFTPLTSTGGVLTSGNYYLDIDKNLTGALTIASGETVNLCLNGRTLKQTGMASVVQNEGTLNICDCAPTAENAADIDDPTSDSGAKITITGGLITGGKGTATTVTGTPINSGGGIFNQGIFTMYGGTIAGNVIGGDSASRYGGGVFSENTFTMYGGVICANQALEKTNAFGGGVYIAEGGTFTMYDGAVTQNTAKSHGGGVYQTAGGEFTMYGGKLFGNKAGGSGGGIYFTGTFNLHVNFLNFYT